MAPEWDGLQSFFAYITLTEGLDKQSCTSLVLIPQEKGVMIP